MGVDGLNSIHYYGAGANGNLGQNNNANQPWPKAAANDYVRAIDFAQPASRATWATLPCRSPAGRAAQGTPAEHHAGQPGLGAAARDLDHAVGLPQGRRGQQRHGASADDRRQAIQGRHLERADQVARRQPYGRRLHQQQNMVERVQTWLENPVFGDMLVEAEYTLLSRQQRPEVPGAIVQKRGGWPTFEAYDPRRARQSREPRSS